MLEYRITWVNIITHTFTDPIVFCVLTLAYLVLGYHLFRVRSKKSRVVILITLTMLPILCVIPTLFDVLSGWNWYGYELYDHKLHIKAWPVDEIINLNNSTVFLTESKEWRPKVRIYGIGVDGVGIGYFKLVNGIKAVVFRYENSKKFVVINVDGKYYVIIHPGVERLYYEIKRIKRGMVE